MSDAFDIDVFLVEFVSECREATEFAVQDVLNLEQGRDQDSVDRIFRALHSIKGNSSMFGLMDLSEFVHKVEDACSDIRSGERAIDKLAINVLLRSFDLIEDAFENIIEKGSDKIDYGRGYALLKELDSDSAVADSDVPQENRAEASVEPVDEPDVEPAESGIEPTLEPVVEVKATPEFCKEPVIEQAGSVPEEPPFPVRENPTALVVDDDFIARKIFVGFLSKFMPCYIAKDGGEAIQAVSQSFSGEIPRFDLIIMDVMMPNIDGLQACKAIRQLEQGRNADSFDSESKIFIASSLSDEKTMHRAMYECGADSYLVKPVLYDDLRRQLVRFRLIAAE
ncbi:response regulator [Maridesulfovibrio sp.]|uniref:ATP-binding response regulator n=1 Tax=Maridesulfovibrio sp. TaxID=2795000 RepID=UPI002A18D94C|nr:response regulator [Maridesulfovibrio sp.]